ncbi:glycosyltransferase family 92 protein [Rhodobacterales bacterium HKCCE3408]|nr:glycosyltransferase family 92 protein [Rhodobacterales bacterium HKCCE3408]
MAGRQDRARRVLSVTPAKNEGPFILEWVAYHRLIGVTDILVFSNDCTDGTDLLLDRLDEMGVLRHFGNPSVLTGTGRHHWTVLNYVNTLSRLKRVDWIVSLDMDEFICVNAGDGTIGALIEACGTADVICMNQLIFGCAGHRDFSTDLQIDRFDRAQNYTGKRRKRIDTRGVKSVTRAAAPIERISNHSPRPLPDEAAALNWVNGAGTAIPADLLGREIKSLPGGVYSYDLVQLNHYAVRSMDSFLCQVARGNANHPTEPADLDYWRRYNINEQRDTRIGRWSQAVRAEMDGLLKDPELAELQAAAIKAHEAEIARLIETPDYSDLRKRIEGAHRRGWETETENA